MSRVDQQWFMLTYVKSWPAVIHVNLCQELTSSDSCWLMSRVDQQWFMWLTEWCNSIIYSNIFSSNCLVCLFVCCCLLASASSWTGWAMSSLTSKFYRGSTQTSALPSSTAVESTVGTGHRDNTATPATPPRTTQSTTATTSQHGIVFQDVGDTYY